MKMMRKTGVYIWKREMVSRGLAESWTADTRLVRRNLYHRLDSHGRIPRSLREVFEKLSNPSRTIDEASLPLWNLKSLGTPSNI
jgi:hypothetical protein